MNKIKKYIKPVLFFLTTFVFYLIVLLALNYTGLLKLNSIVKINFVIISLISLILGIIEGKKTSKRGYLEGLKMSAVIIAIIFILNLIFYRSFSLYILLYYIVITVSCTIGSMIGINLKH